MINPEDERFLFGGKFKRLSIIITRRLVELFLLSRYCVLERNRKIIC